MQRTHASTSAYLRSGAIAGAVSAFLFTAIHQVVISDIWFSLPMMLIAGALCGLCIGWTYPRLFVEPTMRGWAVYNAVYTVMFVVLGAVSVAIYEPVTTMAAVIEANDSPNELIAQAMPMTIIFTLASAGLITWMFGRKWSNLGPVLVTCLALVATLGFNVSAIGLVEIPLGSAYLIAELLGLTAVLGALFAVAFVALEWRTFRGSLIANAIVPRQQP